MSDSYKTAESLMVSGFFNMSSYCPLGGLYDIGSPSSVSNGRTMVLSRSFCSFSISSRLAVVIRRLIRGGMMMSSFVVVVVDAM